ncbi:B12-binding domain-containing radical SAM protein [Brevibacillus brevis]|uniref:B12-binding domain-containing radical SAM protein n=1 Tax=Brevibacillus brevis TaxID=1393 RepID=UPI00115B825A|nr:radical SAM protein [Lysinibacillus sp. SDF0063]TQR35773.1 radical SAM protein [Lysinibacillus sp. SDF0063]
MYDVVICRVAYRSRNNSVNEIEESKVCHAYGAIFDAGVSVKVLDFYLDDSLKIEDIVTTGAKIVLFYVRWPGEFWTKSQQTIFELRKINTEQLVAVFGETSVGQEKALRETPIDVVITGEEPEIVDFVKTILSGGKWNDCTGIMYLNDNQLVVNQGSALIHNLDELPRAKHYWLEYCKENGKPLDFMKAAIRTSRGCYARCKFCFITGYDDLYDDFRWRGRSAENVFEEIKEIYNTYGITEFVFTDANFFNNSKESRQRAKKLSGLILDSGMEIKWLIYTRANDVDEELFAFMKKAGLYAVLMGIESFVPAKLKRYAKGTTVEQNYKAIQILKDLDIYIHPGFILFDKDTTVDEIRADLEGLKWAIEGKPELFVNPIVLVGSIFIPYEGSRSESDYLSIVTDSERFLLGAMDQRMSELDSCLKYGFRDKTVASIADAGWVFAREMGSQQYHKRKLYAQMIERLLVDEDDNEAFELIQKLIEWRKLLAHITIHTFSEIVVNLASNPDPVSARFTELDKAWEKVRHFNIQYLGQEYSDIRWVEEYNKLKTAEKHVVG